MKRYFTWFILLGMIAGIATGWFCHTHLAKADALQVADGLKVVTDIFLRLIKMIIAPLVFSTLVAGIAHMEDAASIGRVGIKTMLWFISASIVSLGIGLLMVQWLQPGVGLNMSLPDDTAKSGIEATKLNLKDFIAHVFPKSIIEAMANNEILQIVVFSIFVGTAVSSLEHKAPDVIKVVEQTAEIMLKVTGFVMGFAPLAIFAALAALITKEGPEIISKLAVFVGGFYATMGTLWVVLLIAGFVFIGPRIIALIGMIREPVLLAFSTASSEAAYPKTMEVLEKFGVSKRIVSFVLPLGYSFNLDGSMVYCTFATLFIAQAYGIHLDITQQLTMLGLLMLTSKGMAGVPRASLVVIAATLSYFKIPEAGLLLILGVDQLLDMGRSATNVVGNSIASAVVGRWEGQLSKSEQTP